MAVITASPKNLGKLIDLQEKSLGELVSIKEILVSGTAVNVAQKSVEVQEKLVRQNDDLIKQNEQNFRAYQEVGENFKIIKTPFEKLGDKFDGLKDTLSDPKRLGLELLPNMLGGIKERALQKNDFIKSQKALGSEKSDKELAADYKLAREAAKDMQKASAELAKMSQLTGLSEEDLSRTKQGAALIGARDEAGNRLAGSDLRASIKGGDAQPALAKPKGVELPPALTPAEQKEMQQEDAKQMDHQTEVLEEIRDSLVGKGSGATAGKGGSSAAEGGGLLDSFGNKMDSLDNSVGKKSNGLIKGAAALVLISGAVWIAADAFQKFSDVEWDDVGKGLVVLGGLVLAATAVSKASGQMIMGAIGIGLLSGAVWVAGEAFKQFTEVDWDAVGKGIVGVAGLAVVGGLAGTQAPLMIAGAIGIGLLSGALWVAGEAFQQFGELGWDEIGKGLAAIAGIGVIGALAGVAAPLLIAGAAGLAALGGSAWIIGEAMQAVGEAISGMVDSLERMEALDGERLTAVADGMLSISGALVAFGAAGAVGGLTSLIGNLLTIGQDSPIEQLEKLAGMSEGLTRAGTGIKSIGESMEAFSKMDPGSIAVLKEVPWDDMEDFADEDGVMIMEKAGAKYTVGSGKAMADAGAFTVSAQPQAVDASGTGTEPDGSERSPFIVIPSTQGGGNSRVQAFRDQRGYDDMSPAQQARFNRRNSRRMAMLQRQDDVANLATKMGMPAGNYNAQFRGGVPIEINGQAVPRELYSEEQLRNIQAAESMRASMFGSNNGGGNAVDQGSAEVAQNERLARTGGNAPTNIVNAPVTSSNTTVSQYRPPIRNQNPLQSRPAYDIF